MSVELVYKCLFLSAAALVICSAFAFLLHKRDDKAKIPFSSGHVFTLGVFLAICFMLVPIYSKDHGLGKDCLNYTRTAFLTVHNSLRIFILDWDLEPINAELAKLPAEEWKFQAIVSYYMAALHIIAPILTFGNLLALFKNLKNELRYLIRFFGKIYIMSELNAKSVALAKSIREKNKNAAIVFTDVFEQNEERDYELMAEVRNMNAICLKRDISHLNISVFKFGGIEIFLIGENESENISQAVKLTTELDRRNKKHNVKIFVFSRSPGGSYILDSVKYDNLLRHASRHDYDKGSFKLRRIDEIQQLIWNTMPEMKLFDMSQKNGNKLSVLIVGFGSYGEEFFKTLVWYCQFEGYTLEINIVDKHGFADKGNNKSYIESLIDRSCPELMMKNRLMIQGEAQYDIEIIPDIDMQTSDFDDLLQYDGQDEAKTKLSERIKNTSIAFVALGDDDMNIETAVHLRTLFDRVGKVNAGTKTGWDDERVQIYSVVYDEQKSGVLHHKKDDVGEMRLLKNHKEIPYHIHFIGGMNSQFDYDNIYNEELEKRAYEHHISWIEAEKRIRAEKALEDSKYVADPSEMKKDYHKHEYFRMSSIAKQLYQEEIEANETLKKLTQCNEGVKLMSCECGKCTTRKRSEHMRWNAYTRVIGYCYNKAGKVERAKLHHNLCKWSDLTDLDRLKD